jgi:hypothetical protein
VQPPLVYDSGNVGMVAASEGGTNAPSSDKSSVGDESMDEGPAEPPNSSGVKRKGAQNEANKRSRSSAGLGDTLRANNEATNKTLKDNEEQRNVRHKENIALREKELELEIKKVGLAEKQAEQASATGAGLISALDKLAAAVFELSKK